MSGMLPPSGTSPKDPKAPDELPMSSVSQGNYLKAIDLFIHVTHIYCKLNLFGLFWYLTANRRDNLGPHRAYVLTEGKETSPKW